MPTPYYKGGHFEGLVDNIAKSPSKQGKSEGFDSCDPPINLI